MQLFLYLLIIVMATFTFCAIYTLINVLIQNKALSAILTILVFFTLFFSSSKLEERLASPQTVFQDIYINGEEVNFRDPIPNPRYVDGLKREIIDFFIDFLPTGQMERVALLRVEHPVRMLASSMFLTIFLTGLGIFLFERKDLK